MEVEQISFQFFKGKTKCFFGISPNCFWHNEWKLNKYIFSFYFLKWKPSKCFDISQIVCRFFWIFFLLDFSRMDFCGQIDLCVSIIFDFFFSVHLQTSVWGRRCIQWIWNMKILEVWWQPASRIHFDLGFCCIVFGANFQQILIKKQPLPKAFPLLRIGAGAKMQCKRKPAGARFI